MTGEDKTRPRRRWARRLGIGCGALLLLLVAAGAALWVWKPWVPPVEQAQPGAGGMRVTVRGNLANFYPGPAGRRSPAVLMLGGSEGGLGEAIDRRGRDLHARGYAVLVLSWYRLPGQPRRLEEVPLEGFYAALDWVAARPDIDPARIGLFGVSKGAEAALLVASRRPQQVRAVVAAMPSHVVWNGFDWESWGVSGSSWSENGRPVPFVPISAGDWREISAMYRNGLRGLTPESPAIIPVERITGDVLLVCGEADSLWPSCLMARAAQQRRATRGGGRTVLLAYPQAGHAGHGPPVAPDSESAPYLDDWGGTVPGNLAARADGWPRTLQFLDRALAGEQSGEDAR